VDVLVQAEQPATSPLTERLRERVSWPHPGRRPEDQDDPVFPEGLAEAVELEQAAPGTLAARVPPGQADAFRAAVEAGHHLLDAARVDLTPARTEPPRILSVIQVLDYARCPRDFYWSVVRPLPSPPKPAARLGSVVHRLLERRARNLPDLLATDDLADDRPGGHLAPELIERASRNVAATRYATLPPPEAEVGVILRLGPWVIRGRIDAIFQAGAGDAEVELVDWKTGRPGGSGGPPGWSPGKSGGSGGRPGWSPGKSGVDETVGGLDQLAIYAVALRGLGRLPGDRCLVSYCYLGGEEPIIDTRTLGPADLDQQRARLEAVLADLDRGDYRRACRRPDCETCRRGLGTPPRPPSRTPP
jgi:PD-(D/E)XK nuclease superfamily